MKKAISRLIAIVLLGGTLSSCGGNATVTIPKETLESISLTDYDLGAGQKGYKSVTYNDDGSVTYILTNKQHEELVEKVSLQIDKELDELVDPKNDEFPITSIETNDNYTSFTVFTPSTYTSFSSQFFSIVFYAYGLRYSIFNDGHTPTVHVEYKNVDSGDIIFQKDLDLSEYENESSDTETSEETTDYGEDSSSASIETESISSSSSETEGNDNHKSSVTAEGIVLYLKDNIDTVFACEVFDEETDPNGNLGRPRQYTGKADFWDNRLVDSKMEENNSGTVEVFSSQEDCDARWEYLYSLTDSSMGIFGLNQYMIMYNNVLFRIDFDYTPSQAKEIVALLNNSLDARYLIKSLLGTYLCASS